MLKYSFKSEFISTCSPRPVLHPSVFSASFFSQQVLVQADVLPHIIKKLRPSFFYWQALILVSPYSIFNKTHACELRHSLTAKPPQTAGSLLPCQPSPSFMGWTTRSSSISSPFSPPLHSPHNPSSPPPSFNPALPTPFASTTTSVMAYCASGLFGLATTASPSTTQTCGGSGH